MVQGVKVQPCPPLTRLTLPPGSLAEWLADHPVMLAPLLPLLLQALGRPELSVSSVSTLKRICRECQHHLGPYTHDIIRVSQVRTDTGAPEGPRLTKPLRAPEGPRLTRPLRAPS